MTDMKRILPAHHMDQTEQDSPGYESSFCFDGSQKNPQSEELPLSSQVANVVLLRQHLREINFDYSAHHKVFHCLQCQTCFEPDAVIRHAINKTHKIVLDRRLKAEITRLITRVPCMLATEVHSSIQTLNVIPFLKLQGGSTCKLCQKTFRGTFHLLAAHLLRRNQF